ncbi:MAG: hypothetical protein ACK4MF_07005 [Hyphomicrobiaceae bacterium]
MRVKTYKEAVRIANSAGLDAAKRRMSKSGRKVMSAADFDVASGETERILAGLGFNIGGWISMAGVPRNEPQPVPRRAAGRPRRQKPVQLSFGF